MPSSAALRKGAMSIALGLACLLLLSSHSSAQVSTATINGTVLDATGAVVPEAELVLQSVETGVERRSVSNSVGVYTFVSITPGIYVLSATREGFRTSSLPSLWPSIRLLHSTSRWRSGRWRRLSRSKPLVPRCRARRPNWGPSWPRTRWSIFR